MSMLIVVVGVIVVTFLSWNLYRRFGSDQLEVMSEKRRKSSRLVTRGSFVDGNRHLDVVLALDKSTFFYENADMEASLDLQFLREIEYDTRLVTGEHIPEGKVLRLRSTSQTFEFVLAEADIQRWHLMLPGSQVAGTPRMAQAT